MIHQELDNRPAQTMLTDAEAFCRQTFGIPVTLTHFPRLGRNHIAKNGSPLSVGSFDHSTGRVSVSPIISDILYETIVNDPDATSDLVTAINWTTGTFGFFTPEKISPHLSSFIRLTHNACREFAQSGNPLMVDTVLLLMDRLPNTFEETTLLTNHLLSQLLLNRVFSNRYRQEIFENAVHESAHAWLYQLLKPQLLTEPEWRYIKSLLSENPPAPEENQIRQTDPDSFNALPLAEVKNMAVRTHQAFARRFPHQPEIQETLLTHALYQGLSEEIARAVSIQTLQANDKYDSLTLQQYASRLGFIPHAGNGDRGIMFFRRLLALGGLPRLRDAAIRLWEDIEDMAKLYAWQIQPQTPTL